MSNRLISWKASVLALFILSAVLVWLDFQGFLAEEMAFFGAKALEVFYGPEPRLQATGFVFPPVLVYGTVAVGSPITLQVLAGALLVGLISRTIDSLPISQIWCRLWIALIVFNPAFALMLLRSPNWVITTLLVMGIMGLSWAIAQPKTMKLPLSLVLVLLGFALAILMLVRYEAWFISPLVIAILLSIFPKESWGFRGTAILVTLFMSLVAIAAWLYLNWQFTGNAFQFFNSAYSGFYLPGTEVFLQQSNPSLLLDLTIIMPLLLAYLLGIVWLLWQAKQRWVNILIAVLPILLIVLAIWQETLLREISYLGLLLGLLPLIWQQAPPRKAWQQGLFTVVLVISWIGSGLGLQNNQALPEETVLWRQLTGQKLPQSLLVQQWVQRHQDQRQIANMLHKNLGSNQRVLMDDAINFPIVYQINDPRYFILPYQYEFIPALQQPELFAEFIVVSKPQSPIHHWDQVSLFWSQLADPRPIRQEVMPLSEFKSLLETPYYRLLQRLDSP